MSRYGDKNVIARGVILWDGVTRPELKDDGKGGKRTQYSLKVALLTSQPEVNEVAAICTDALNADTTFRGKLPPGGCWPLIPVDPQQFEGRLPQHVAFSCKTYRTPQVFDINRQEIAPMIYGPMLYPGAIVDVLVSAFAFANVSKGIALSLDGIMIIDATAPRLPVGGVDAGAAFGSAPAPQPAGYSNFADPNTPTYQPPVQPGGPSGYAPPASQPVYQAPPQQPMAGVQPAPDFLNPPVPPVAPQPPPPAHVMTAKAAGQTYEAFRQAGWSDEQLIANGYM
jgi:hypothetical protein